MLGPKSQAGTEQLSLAGSGCEATDYLVCGGKETDVILVPIRARVEGPSTFVSLISGLDSNKEDTKQDVILGMVAKRSIRWTTNVSGTHIFAGEATKLAPHRVLKLIARRRGCF
jgi:hypothetical protein